MFGIAENLKTFLQKSIQQWRLSLTSSGDDLGEVNVKRGIFQGDSLSPLLFVLCMVPLSLILKKVNACYKWGKKEYKVNHLLFMDDLKLYAKSEEQTNALVRTVYVFSTDISMKFGIKKCGILTMKRGKIVKCEGMKLPDGEVTGKVHIYFLKRKLFCSPCFSSILICCKKLSEPITAFFMKNKNRLSEIFRAFISFLRVR